MTCNDVGLCLNVACCLSKFSASTVLKASNGEECKIPFFVFILHGEIDLLFGTRVSIFSRCSCKAWPASAAWRPCKSNFHGSLSLFRMLKISLAALALSCSAADHFSRALNECCWAEKWSLLKKALVAALECWDANLFNGRFWEFPKSNVTLIKSNNTYLS